MTLRLQKMYLSLAPGDRIGNNHQDFTRVTCRPIVLLSVAATVPLSRTRLRVVSGDCGDCFGPYNAPRTGDAIDRGREGRRSGPRGSQSCINSKQARGIGPRGFENTHTHTLSIISVISLWQARTWSAASQPHARLAKCQRRARGV